MCILYSYSAKSLLMLYLLQVGSPQALVENLTCRCERSSRLCSMWAECLCSAGLSQDLHNLQEQVHLKYVYSKNNLLFCRVKTNLSLSISWTGESFKHGFTLLSVSTDASPSLMWVTHAQKCPLSWTTSYGYTTCANHTPRSEFPVTSLVWQSRSHLMF